jgi:hypothetical protein
VGGGSAREAAQELPHNGLRGGVDVKMHTLKRVVPTSILSMYKV